MKLILSILLLFCLTNINGQTISYSYIDPCTGVLKQLNVPDNGITITYFNQIKTFSKDDFTNGNFNTWATGVYNQFGENNPCGSAIGISNSIDIGQSTALNVISILNSLSAIADMQASSTSGSGMIDITSGLMGSSKSANKKENKKKNKESNTEGGGTTNTPPTNTSGNSTNANSNETNSVGNTETPANNQNTENNNNTNNSSSTQQSNSQTSGNSQNQSSSENVSVNGNSSNSNSSSSNANSNSNTNGTTSGSNNNQGSEGNTQSNSGNDQQGGTQNSNSSTNSSTNVQGGNSGTSDQPTESGGSQTESPVENNTTGNSTTQNNNSTSSGNSSTTDNSETPKAPDQSANSDAANQEKKSTNLLGGTVNSIANASGKSEGNKPTVVLSSDFTGFNFRNNDVEFGGKVTGGFTSMRWDGRRTHGFLVDYTSIIRGPNVTAFYAFVSKKRIDLLSLTGTASFYGRGSMYGTLALGQMWTIKKNAKVLYLATASWGHVYQESFIGTAFITGGMYDWKIGKRFDIKMMGLFIYAPFVSYYNDIVLKSPYVIMPVVGTNVAITKKFKLNINMSGTYAIKENVLNFTVMLGTRFAL